MLDAIEARISALRPPATVEGPAREGIENAAVVLQAELRAVGLSAGEFARLACVPPDALNGRIDADGVSRQWISAAIRMIAHLTPSARRRLLQSPAAVPARTNSHPFSRIEDL